MKSFLDLNPPTLPQSLLRHSSVAQAWGAQTQCQRLAFPAVRGSLAGRDQHTAPCCAGGCVFTVRLWRNPAAGAGDRFPPCQAKSCNSASMWWAQHTSDADVIKMPVTRRCLLRCGAESLLSSWDCSSAEAQLPASFSLTQLPSEEPVFQKSPNTLNLSFLLSEIIV